MRLLISSRRPGSGGTPATEGVRSAPAAAGRHTGIAPANLEAVLNSAANAGFKGQAQWHTPAEWGAILAQGLPSYRPVLVDLTCGNGQLLLGAAAGGTRHLLGADIEDLPFTDPAGRTTATIHADITLLADYLARADWTADCFVLNYPFDHHWYRERLAFLGRSDCAAVEVAFNAHDGRTGKDTIDSTVAGLCLALDRCSPYGEGFIIANHSTVERLLFREGAPHAALASHVWARVTIAGNICATRGGAAPATGDAGDGFKTSVLYFARAHTGGPNRTVIADTMDEAREACAKLGRMRVALRAGSVIRQFEGGHTADTASLWAAIGLEWRTVQGRNRPGDARWNIWLEADGTIATNLTPFQEASEPLKKQQYVKLNSLKGRHPMQLILQKAERKELERAVFGTVWRVAPAVTEAVQGALAEYNAVRSPLYPLTKIQRLGYLDDNDDILCLSDLDASFSAGRRYTIRTETISVARTGTKMNLTGGVDAVSWEGSELALFIKDDEGIERLFMEERLRAPNVRLSIQAENAPSPIEYNLQQLVEHFEIPEVPDVAVKNPAGYRRNLDLLEQIESIINTSN